MAKQGLGYTHILTAIDADSRLIYSEFAGIEKTINCVAFLDRAVAWFADHGITIERSLTDNGNGYRSIAWKQRCGELGIKTPEPSLPSGHDRQGRAVQPDTAR